MTLDGTYAAALDRMTEGIAVFLVEDGGETIDERRIDAEELPEDVSEGDICRLTFENGALVGIDPQPDATAERRKRLRERFDTLSRRLGEE